MSAVVLASAGMFTAWAGFQSDQWSGVQLTGFTAYGGQKIQAAKLEADAERTKSMEMALLGAWMNAEASGQPRLAHFYRERLPPNLRPAFEEWYAMRPLENSKAPRSPFELPSYSRADTGARELNAKADATFKAAQEADRIADSFGQGNVMLAMAMFFAGITQVFRVRKVQMVLLSVGVMACVLGLARVLSLPMQHP